MVTLLACLALTQYKSPVWLDDYGVAHIRAASSSEAFQHAGAQIARDRLWQMEGSRRIARGKMSEAFGPAYVKADTEALLTGYTDADLQAQFERLPAHLQSYFTSYAEGINGAINRRKAQEDLPPGYKEFGFEPEPWSVLDSVAIAIKLFQTFGQGGAGEIRNFALFKYLQGRPNKEQALDIFDDFLWQNHPTSPTTIAPIDDPLKATPVRWPVRSRPVTENHVKTLPNLSLMELLPAVKLAMREEQTLAAEDLSAPFKFGSYAVVVSPQRSATGMSMLLSAPQMGHKVPAIIHEMSIDSPAYSAVGMDVPGVPGIAIGHTKHGAWALTSGVADTADIFVSRLDGADRYFVGEQSKPLIKIVQKLKVKGEPDREVVQYRTEWGPVILRSNSAKVVFSQVSSFWMRELESMEALFGMTGAKTVNEVESALRKATVSFNCHYALNTGDIGYRFVGMVPLRAEGVDPRFPTPAEPGKTWRGLIPYEQMPHMVNPKSGLITNWNNKPVAWWENGDTPVWGRTFRVEALRAALPPGKLSLSDVEMGAWWIARMEPVWGQMGPIIRKHLLDAPDRTPYRQLLLDWDGRTLMGTPSPVMYAAFEDALREVLFMETTGNFMSPGTFKLITQQALILEALEGKTKTDYRHGRSISTILAQALDKAMIRLRDSRGEISTWQYQPGMIGVPGEQPIPYIDRGSYIQVIQLPAGRLPVGRNVVNPGVSESGKHSLDQVHLARSWTYKRMGW
jgi:penicillin amidase